MALFAIEHDEMFSFCFVEETPDGMTANLNYSKGVATSFHLYSRARGN